MCGLCPLQELPHLGHFTSLPRAPLFFSNNEYVPAIYTHLTDYGQGKTDPDHHRLNCLMWEWKVISVHH